MLLKPRCLKQFSLKAHQQECIRAVILFYEKAWLYAVGQRPCVFCPEPCARYATRDGGAGPLLLPEQ